MDRLRPLLNYLFWTLLFAVAYAQSPLYTSNQNLYFLHGLARAGFGFLYQDWLANTSDPTPVFSLLVSLTHRYIHLEAMYYLYYAFLMGIYLFSLLGIASILYNLQETKIKTLAFLALIILMHSAGLRFALLHTLGPNWMYLMEDGVADQRLLGPVFQPSVFGVFLMLSIYLFLKGKSYLAVLSAILSVTVHPTYLLSAAALIIAYLVITWREERNISKTISLGLVAFVSVSPILWYTFSQFGATAHEIAEKARQILILFRIPHHAIIGQWLDATAIIKVFIICLAIYLVRKTRLFFIVLIAFTIAVTLTLLQLLSNNNSLALLFPWRISTFLFPLSMAVILAALVTRLLSKSIIHTTVRHKMVNWLSLALILSTVLVGSIRFPLDLIRKSAIPERLLFDYVSANKTPGETYLTPLKMQDFRLATGAPAFIDFKSNPYKDIDVLEWFRRIQIARDFYQAPDCKSLPILYAQEKITHLILETPYNLKCSFLQETFKDNNFILFAVRAP